MTKHPHLLRSAARARCFSDDAVFHAVCISMAARRCSTWPVHPPCSPRDKTVTAITAAAAAAAVAVAAAVDRLERKPLGMWAVFFFF